MVSHNIRFEIDAEVGGGQLGALWNSVWSETRSDFDDVLERGLAYVCAFDGETLVGFVNVAWDGGAHAFIVDTSVHPQYRRQGIATAMVKFGRDAAREQGAKWLHVDFEPQYAALYLRCGFRETAAGVLAL